MLISDFLFGLAVVAACAGYLFYIYRRECQHDRTTFPCQSPGDDWPHITCLDCGAEFDYDWTTMKRGARRGGDQ